ncbi:MAG: hypothetical protein FWB78_09810 [Treponema sp.]|nr:hypothetical protein [Treponema sp.]
MEVTFATEKEAFNAMTELQKNYPGGYKDSRAAHICFAAVKHDGWTLALVPEEIITAAAVLPTTGDE